MLKSCPKGRIFYYNDNFKTNSILAGIYIHIPFCKKACHYCDFHFSTNQTLKQELVDAICIELISKIDFLNYEKIESIYFGGGTPSLLSEIQLNQIINTIYTNYSISENPEITLEANPDDLDKLILNVYLKSGINRLSIGIQTFNNQVLKWMNRVHDAKQALYSVKNAQDLGFENLSVDLIYAIPELEKKQFQYAFEDDLQKFIELNVSHISAYNLTIEPRTTFGKWHKNGTIKTIEDTIANAQFDYLISELAKNGYEQYEISNFARNNKTAIHNTSYWFGKKYLGIGPSAHSFDCICRYANVSNNAKYIQSINQKIDYQTIEKLSAIDFANEHLLTRLRTKWGADIDYICQNLTPLAYKIFLSSLGYEINKGNIFQSNNYIFLTQNGKKIADSVTSNLFST